MNKKIKAVLLFFMAAAFLFNAVSCANSGSTANNDEIGNKSTEGESAETEIINESDNKLPQPELPDIDFSGRNFVITTEDYSIPVWVQRDIHADEETGDTINDAVYKRNAAVNEKFNCNIVEMKFDPTKVDISSEIRKFVNAGDAGIDAVTVRLRFLTNLISSGALVEFGQMEYVDLTKPWWDQNCVRDLSIDGKLFGVASDITIRDNDSTSAVVFNKKLQADYQIENLYGLVGAGEWTLDKLLELSKTVSIDVDGNGVKDDKDAYGLLYQRDSLPSFLNGCGIYIGGKDENNLPLLTLNTQKAYDVLNKLYDILYDDTYCFHVMKFFDGTAKGFTDGMNEIFQNDRALFMWIRLADVENLRGMDTDFGILPIPKYDGSQEKYYQNVNPHVGVVTGFIQSAEDNKNSSAVIEYMAYESKYILQPAYYDVVLTTKIARDEESSKMLDIIFANRTYDIGDVFDFGGLGDDVINMSMTYDRNIASKIEKKEAKATKDIAKLTDAIQAVN